jgi:uncharacterized membrane protein YphA (DoxX/SURF4 family)
MGMEARDRNTMALAALRISVGMLFLIFGDYKVFDAEFIWRGGFQIWINRFLTDGAYPFMVPVLQKLVLPHAAAIAFLVAYGELAIGLALVLGIFVRPASICGLIYMLTCCFVQTTPDLRLPSGSTLELLSTTRFSLFAFRHLFSGKRIEPYRFVPTGQCLSVDRRLSATCSSPERRNRNQRWTR